MEKIHDFEGSEEDNNCHICGRDMENYTPREGTLYELDDGRKYTEVEMGIGTCPEHGVSYDEISVKPARRGGCQCGKDDCPRCSQ